MYAARRKAVLDGMVRDGGEGVMIIPSPPTFIRNNDVEHEYRQGSDLYYLTGFDEPDSVLVLSTKHAEHRAVLFLRARDPERETWDGPRLGSERAPAALGIDAAFHISELEGLLPGYLENVKRVHYRLGLDRRFDERFLNAMDVVRMRARRGGEYPTEFVDPGVLLHEMRLKKRPDEVALMRRASEITREAHLAAMKAALPGRYEYEVEAELLRTFRAHGSERPAYGSIVGAGPNATILHYRKNDRRLEEGDLLLIDAGAEFGYYASDVTRTFPVSGRFTGAQRAIYDLVLRAQLAAIAEVRPGATIEGVHDKTVEVLVDGLLELGLLSGDRQEVIDKGDYKKFYMHRTSHWLGMDVHDVGRYHRAGAPRPFEPGFVLTVEPGLYISAHADVEPAYRGIGVRIEDDILVTSDGHDNLTFDIPKTAPELESILSAR
ncbi:MAG: Xaa-Pro aminopeptidase [Myxococcaceae bacterium]|nr:Xaa-Pro aminopeptidase [Myxococcaceae bacterium]